MHDGIYVTAPPCSPVKIFRSKGQGHSALLAEGRHRLLGQGLRPHQHLQLPAAWGAPHELLQKLLKVHIMKVQLTCTNDSNYTRIYG